MDMDGVDRDNLVNDGQDLNMDAGDMDQVDAGDMDNMDMDGGD
jgi:hypothetical protein